MSQPLLESTGRRRIRPKTLIHVGVIIALAVTIVFIALAIQKPRLPFSLSDYEQAYAADDDDRVFEIYDRIRGKRADLLGISQTVRVTQLIAEAEKIIDRIEQDAGNKSKALILSASQGGNLSEQSIAWLDQYAAMTSHRMSEAVLEQVTRYFDGDMDQDKFTHFLNEMLRVPHLVREFEPLKSRHEDVTQISKLLQEANDAAGRGNLYQEASVLSKIIEEKKLLVFEPVSSYLENRLKTVQSAYYAEQIILIREEMSLAKTYDASIRIKRIIGWFPDDHELQDFYDICIKKNPERIITWWNPVEHIAIKPIIADAERAFDGDRFSASAGRELILAVELERALGQLYDHDYVLVDSRSFVSADGKLRGMPCPAGKKPVVLVLEDFYGSLPRAESGIAWRLDVNQEGCVTGVLLDSSGEERADTRYSAIGIVEEFIAKYPDFSFNGATGAIAVVGQYGIFGYPVSDIQDLALRREAMDLGIAIPESLKTDFALNRSKVHEVVKALNSKNWTLASGTFDRLQLPNVTLQTISQDLAMMERWVVPYTGELSTLYCPFGEHVEFDAKKVALIAEAGYTLQSGYGSWAYWNQNRAHVYVSRTFLSGDGLKQSSIHNLNRFFDTRAIIESNVRPG